MVQYRKEANEILKTAHVSIPGQQLCKRPREDLVQTGAIGEWLQEMSPEKGK